MKFKILILFCSMFFFTSCLETIEPDYINELDPNHPNYIPSSPSALNYRITNNGVQINWIDNSYGEDRFIIERSDSLVLNFVQIGFVGANKTSFIDTIQIEFDKDYFYRVKAIKDKAESTYSPNLKVTISGTSSAPIILGIEVISKEKVNINWLDKSNFEEGFRIKRKIINNGSNKFEVIASLPQDDVSYTIEDLDTSKLYLFKVSAFLGQNELNSEAIKIVYGIEEENSFQLSEAFGSEQVGFSPSENFAVFSGDNSQSKIKSFNVETGMFFNSNLSDNVLKFHPSGDHIGILNHSSDNDTDLLQIIQKTDFSVIKSFDSPIHSFDFDNVGNTVAFFDLVDKNLVLCNYNSRDTVWEKNNPSYTNPAFSSDNSYIVCSNQSGIFILNSTNGEEISSFISGGSGIRFAVLAPDNKYLFVSVSSTLEENSLLVYTFPELNLFKTLEASNNVSFDRFSNFFASAGRKVYLYNLSTIEKIGELDLWSQFDSANNLAINYRSDKIIYISSIGSPRIFLLKKNWLGFFD